MKRMIIKKQDRVIAKSAVLADTFLTRLRGLMCTKKMVDFDGMLIRPSNSIHTFGMHFPIDVVFLNSNFKVVKVIENMKPWRLTPPYWGANQVLELNAGTLNGLIKKGDQLEISNV